MRQLLVILLLFLLHPDIEIFGQSDSLKYVETISTFSLKDSIATRWHYDDMGTRDSLGNPLGWSLSNMEVSPAEFLGSASIGDSTTPQYFVPTQNDVQVLLHNTRYKCEPITRSFAEDDFYKGLPYWLQGTWTYKSFSFDSQGTPSTYSEAFDIMDDFATLLLPAYAPLGRVLYSEGRVCIGNKQYRVVKDSYSNSHILVSDRGDEFHNTGGITEKCIGYNISLIGRNNSQVSFSVHSTPKYIMTATSCGDNTFWALKLSFDQAPEIVKVADTTKLSLMVVRRDYAEGEKWRQHLSKVAAKTADDFFKEAIVKHSVTRPIHKDIPNDREPFRKRFEEYERRYYDISTYNSDSPDYSYFRISPEELWISPADYRMLHVYGQEIIDSLLMCHDKVRYQIYQKTCQAKQLPEFKALQGMLDELNNNGRQLFDYSVWVTRSGEIRVRVLTSKQTRKLFSLFQKFLKKYAKASTSEDLTFSLTDRYYTQASEGNGSSISLRAPIFGGNPMLPSYGGYIEYHKRTDFKLGSYDKTFENGFYAHLFMDYMQQIRESAEKAIQMFVGEFASDITDINFKPIIPLKNSLSYVNLLPSNYSISLDNRYEVIPFLQTDLEDGMPIYEISFSVRDVDNLNMPKGIKVNLINVDQMPPYGGFK